MIKIDFVPPDNSQWTRWCQDAASEHTLLLQLYAASQPVSIRDSLYKRRAKDFFDDSWAKCAYCEALMILDQTGDIEHFRPKGAVTDENDDVVMISDDLGTHPHPGYFWLAYDWKNLLPSCINCNRPRRTRDGRLVGKSTRFPVVGAHAVRPAEVDREAPKLINPLVEEPSEHLDMDVDTGVLFGKSDRGEMCIRILDLNRERLPETRRQVYDTALLCAVAYHSALIREDAKQADRNLDILMGHKSGRSEYSLAGRKAIEIYKKVLRRQGNLFV